MEGLDWSVVFFVETSGRSPIREFLESLDVQTQARLRRAIELLLQRNVQAGEPLVRHLESKLWELGVEGRSRIYRLIYAFDSGRRVVVLHGFEKKTQKTPRREIEIAFRRMDDFQARKGTQPA